MANAQRSARKAGKQQDERLSADWLTGSTDADVYAPQARGSAARPAKAAGRRRVDRLPGPPLLTLPSMPAIPAISRPDDDQPYQRPSRQSLPPERDEWGESWQEWDAESDSIDDEWSAADGWGDADDDLDDLPAEPVTRSRMRSAARPLSKELPTGREMVPVASAPRLPVQPVQPVPVTSGRRRALALPEEDDRQPTVISARQPAERPRPRPRLNTEMLVRRARSPWTIARAVLAVATLTLAFWSATAKAGEPNQPFMAGFSVSADSHSVPSIASLVQPFTQYERTDLYDSSQQYWDWRNAACSAAVSAEVMTAWGAKGATIGTLIDAIGPDISLDGGLINEQGFERGAAAFGFRADIHHDLSYAQILYLANQLGIPVIVNVRISYGYYHFFDGGHFLVVTGGDDQGVRIVDSSLYKIHYLPLDVFNSMFTHREFIIVPKDYKYTLPAI